MELHALKERLMHELRGYAERDEMSAGALEVIDKLTHTIKNLCKIIDEEEKNSGYSYRRGAKRDSMGRYATDEMTEKLHELMDIAPDEKTRVEIHKLMSKLETM